MSALAISEVLDRAADLIEPEGAWTRHVFARGPSRNPANPFSDHAVCFCMRGAICRASGRGLADELTPFNEALHFRSPQAMAQWNDAPVRTQAEVVAKLREAASLAREQGK